MPWMVTPGLQAEREPTWREEEELGHPPFLPALRSFSPVPVLVGAAISSQVEDEDALGELICMPQGEGKESVRAFFRPKASASLYSLPRPPRGCAANASIGRWWQRGGGPPNTRLIP